MRCLRVVLVGFDHELNAEPKQRTGAGMHDDAERVLRRFALLLTPIASSISSAHRVRDSARATVDRPHPVTRGQGAR